MWWLQSILSAALSHWWMDEDDWWGDCSGSLSSRQTAWNPACTYMYRRAFVWFHHEPLNVWRISVVKSFFGDACQGRVTHRIRWVYFEFLPQNQVCFCYVLVQTKCLPPAYLINKSRVKHLTCGWGGSGRAVGDLDNVCRAFLLVGVWFPWLVNFSHEVRRIHSQSHQSWEGFDQPMRRTGSQQESLSSAADRDSPGFQGDKPCGQWPNGIILQHECSQALYNIIQESVIIGLLHACRSSLIFLPAGINTCIAK